MSGRYFWDKLCAIPRYGFIHSRDNSRVLKVEGIGNWIDQHAAQEVVDAAQDEINALAQRCRELENERDNLVGMVRAARIQRDTRAQACLDAIKERDTLRAEVEQLRKDAERYRGVRRVAAAQGYTEERFDEQTDRKIARLDAAMRNEQ